jgi:dTDP-4-amino-4,6-dideoxygalactose transaminase
LADLPKIPVLDLQPELSEVRSELEAAFRRVCGSGRFILGPETEGFEREVAAYLGVKHAIGVNSGTDALVIALRALGIGPGHEVIVPTFTFFATAESVNAAGATPVFADLDPETFNLSAASVDAAITPRTKAIIPVHLFGQSADMDALEPLARDRGLLLVEDVAQALGGAWRGKMLGTIGAAAAFSFFPSKNLGCLGDGGLVATSDDEVAGTARMLRAHGSRRKYYNEAIGYNSRLDALQAAFLRAKLPHLQEWNGARREAAERYRELLAGIPGIVLPGERPEARHVYHQFTIRVLEGRRDALKEFLAAGGIESMIYYPVPLHRLSVYASRPYDLPQAEAAAREVLSLPFWPRIPGGVQTRVQARLREFATRAERSG